MTLSETDLISRLKKGDLDAFDGIYANYSGKLYSFGMRYLRSEADAEELVQSVFLKIWENRRRIDDNLSFHSYLFTIAYNDICKLFRQKNYLKKYVSEVLHDSEESSDAAEEGADYRSVLAEVNRIVAAMPEKQKKAFLKSRLEGKPSKEIAAELGLSPATVDNYVSSALKTLKASIRKENLPLVLFLILFII